MPALMAALCRAGVAVTSPGPPAMGHPMASDTFPGRRVVVMRGGRAQGACSRGG